MKVAILLPTMGRMEAVLHDWIVRNSMRGYEVVDMKAYGVAPVEGAFNRLHKKFLESDCDYAFILNDDECPPDDAIERLAAHDKDVCSGVCWHWVSGKGPCPVSLRWNDEAEKYTYVYGSGLERIDRVSMSGVLAKRKVLEAIPVGTYRHPKLNEDGTEWGSPGFAFWDAARERGFEIWMDFDVRLHHYKSIDLLEVNDLMAGARTETVEWVADKVKGLRETMTDAEIVGELVKMG